MQITFKYIQDAADYIQSRSKIKPEFGIILGTGLGSLVNDLEIDTIIEYEKIPHFPISTVESHTGKMILGKLSGKNVIVMQGRFHYYEGYSMQQVTFPVRVFKLLGIKALMVSNAAGALNPSYGMSELMIISDHINLQIDNPLRGRNLDEFGVRFPDMSEPYDFGFIKIAHQIAKENQIKIHEGVYVSVTGPNLETRAEYRMLSRMGADVVGMSTVPEVIVARQANIPVFAISVLTDLCAEGTLKKVTLEDVLAAAALAEPNMALIFKELIKRI
ncbi:MAG: purine-nucleoside phosphorylase [Bacteroidetes bacterium]|nr:MAG: purine-nucleoside phosphorylase [Bacteroidota bacterium]